MTGIRFGVVNSTPASAQIRAAMVLKGDRYRGYHISMVLNKFILNKSNCSRSSGERLRLWFGLPGTAGLVLGVRRRSLDGCELCRHPRMLPGLNRPLQAVLERETSLFKKECLFSFDAKVVHGCAQCCAWMRNRSTNRTENHRDTPSLNPNVR